MKFRLFMIITVLALVVAMAVPNVALAGAYDTTFTTSITYQNVGSAATTTLTVQFYPDPTTTTPIPITRPNLAANASTSLFIGSLGEIDPGFQGSAVMQSDQPLLATMVQLPQGSATVKNRPLSNGFSEGTQTVLLATVLKNQFSNSSRFAVQNAGGSTVHVTIKFYNTSAQLINAATIEQDIEVGAGFHVDAGTVAGLPDPFNGSAVIESNGSIVASVMELGTGSNAAASAFEGVGAGSNTFYMPSALCNAFGGTNTAYAVQNTSLTTATDVTVTYSNGKTQTANIGAGAKASFVACSASGMPGGFSGAAVVESQDTPVVAIGKAYGLGLSTAFVGASSGFSRLALPYVRWASDANWLAGTQQRVFITIQNIGGSDLAAGAVTVQYIDKNGNVLGTDDLPAIAVGAKVNSSANAAGLSEFGVYPDGSFGGGAIIAGPDGAELAVVARVATNLGPGSQVAEDYNAMPIP